MSPGLRQLVYAVVLGAACYLLSCKSQDKAPPPDSAAAGAGNADAAAGDAPAHSDGVAGDPVAAPALRPDRQQVLADLVRIVMLPGYAQVHAQATQLAAALAALRQTPSATTLLAARESWRLARASWRRTTAFGLGPADDLGLTGGIIDEPTNVVRLQSLLAASTLLDATAVLSLPASSRGLLAIEFLLFGPDAAATPEAVAMGFAGAEGARRALLIDLLGADLAAKLAAVDMDWQTRYGREVELAGRGSAIFARERDAYDGFLNKALAITDRTIDIVRKASGGESNVALPIAAVSDNIAADLLDDLRGLEALYTGRVGGTAGRSIAEVVRDMNPAADTEMLRALAEARVVLAALPRPLSPVGLQTPPVMQAITALRALKAALAIGVFNALGVSIGFSDNDGD